MRKVFAVLLILMAMAVYARQPQITSVGLWDLILWPATMIDAEAKQIDLHVGRQYMTVGRSDNRNGYIIAFKFDKHLDVKTGIHDRQFIIAMDHWSEPMSLTESMKVVWRLENNYLFITEIISDFIIPELMKATKMMVRTFTYNHNPVDFTVMGMDPEDTRKAIEWLNE